MRAFALALMVLAGSASAETNPITYQGLTIGAPLPADATPLTSIANSESWNAVNLPPYALSLCEHNFLPAGAKSLTALSDGCDGPIQSIVASFARDAFFDPDGAVTTLDIKIADMTFLETPLKDVRARFCSDGLIAPRWFGQTEPDNVNAFALAYEIENSTTIAAFWFQRRRAGFLSVQPEDGATADSRNAAVLVAINVMSADMFANMTDGPAMPSAGYAPIPNVFDPDAATPTACPVS